MPITSEGINLPKIIRAFKQVVEGLKCGYNKAPIFFSSNERLRISCSIQDFVLEKIYKQESFDLIQLLKYVKFQRVRENFSISDKVELYLEFLSIIDIDANIKHKDQMFLLVGYVAINDLEIIETPHKNYCINKIIGAIPSYQVATMLYRSDEASMEKLFPIKLFNIISQNKEDLQFNNFNRHDLAPIQTSIAKKHYRDFCDELNKCTQNNHFSEGNIATCKESYKKACVV